MAAAANANAANANPAAANPAAANSAADIELVSFSPNTKVINENRIESDLKKSIDYMTKLQKEGRLHAAEVENYKINKTPNIFFNNERVYGLYNYRFEESNIKSIEELLEKNNTSLGNLCIYFITYKYSNERPGSDRINRTYTKVEKVYTWRLHIVCVNANKITSNKTLKLTAARNNDETPLYLKTYTLTMFVHESTWLGTILTPLQDYILKQQKETRTPYIMYKGIQTLTDLLPKKGGYNHKIHTYRKKSKHTRRNTRRNTKRYRK
jgi:hypothetical protein